MVNPHAEAHRGEHAGWLRAAVLGANDGLVSTASPMVGVAASGAAAAGVLTAGVAGLAAGSTAMGAREYVSVSSQVDVERADRAKEVRELAASWTGRPHPTAKLWLIVAVTLIGLAVAGILGTWIAGTALARPALRVVMGGGLAMLVTALFGQLVHVAGI